MNTNVLIQISDFFKTREVKDRHIKCRSVFELCLSFMKGLL